MIRFIIIGVWVCAVALGSSYAAAYWTAGAASSKAEEPYLAGLEYRRTPNVTIPMIVNGGVQGYVLARLVYTADAAMLRTLPVEPVIFVVNAAFEEIYTNGRVESGKVSKYNLNEMLQRIKVATNTRLNGEVIRDVLVDSLNYIDKTDMRSGVGVNTASSASPKDHGKDHKSSESKSGH
ncbi:hypothetical protein [Xanthobacter sp. ZOL 2024]